MKKSFVLFVSNSPDGGRRLSTCTRCPLRTCSASHASAEPRLSHQQHEDLLSYRSTIRTPGPLQPTIEHIQTTERPGGGASRICERENTVRDDTLSIGRGRKLRERAGGRCCAFVLRAHDILLLSRSVYGSITLESIRRFLTHVKLPGLDPDTSLQ